MPVFAIIIGVILDALGILAYVLTGMESLTALIPSIFGTIILVCGILALIRPAWRKHAMHVAAAVALLGFVAVMARTGGKIPALFAGEAVEPSATAVWVQLTFALISFIFLMTCIRSFVAARMARISNS